MLCHCEERSDEAISSNAINTGLLRYARNDKINLDNTNRVCYHFTLGLIRANIALIKEKYDDC